MLSLERQQHEATLRKVRVVAAERTIVAFRIIGAITHIQVIARGPSVRIRRYLNEEFGPGRWRKMKGRALIEWDDGRSEYAEVHWFEAHGVGRALMKRKRGLEE